MGREAGRSKFSPDFSVQFVAFPVFAALILILVLCLGGGTRPGLLPDVASQLASIPLLLWALWRLSGSDAGTLPKFGLGLLALLMIYPLLQLLPLWPPASMRGVGRELEGEVLALVGRAGSGATISVAGEATLLSLISLLPAAAVFLATLAMPGRHRRWFAAILIGFAFVSVILGLLQLSQGSSSPLRFYAVTNPDDAVGFFANRNHFAALLNCALVLTGAWLLFVASDAGMQSSMGRWRQILIIAGFTLIVSLIAGQAMSRSRAGVGIAVVATGLCCLFMSGLVRPAGSKANPLRVLAMTVGIAIVVAAQYGAYRLVERFDVDPLNDARTTFAQMTYQAIQAYAPFGSGLGTFTQVYPAFEGLGAVLLGTYVNRAHNDLVEYALETGVFAPLLLGAALVYFGIKAIALWRPGLRLTLDVMLQRAAAGVLVLVLLHSIFDYPLRTGAMLAVLAVCAGLLLASPDDEFETRSAPSASRRDAQSAKGKHARSRSQTQTSASNPDASKLPKMPPERMEWGQDIAWPDAWKADGKKSGKASTE